MEGENNNIAIQIFNSYDDSQSVLINVSTLTEISSGDEFKDLLNENKTYIIPENLTIEFELGGYGSSILIKTGNIRHSDAIPSYNSLLIILSFISVTMIIAYHINRKLNFIKE